MEAQYLVALAKMKEGLEAEKREAINDTKQRLWVRFHDVGPPFLA